MSKPVLFFITALLSILAFADSPTENAIRASSAAPSDPPLTKIALLLHLLNDSPYLSESSPDPRFKDFAKFKSTPINEANQLIQTYGKDSSGSPYAPYDLDSVRTPEEMLSQRIGGSCGTQAQVFARLLNTLGVPNSDIRIVSAVCEDEYKQFCSGGKGSRIDPSYRGGASGHVFVEVKIDGKWKLINTTYAPFLNRSGPHADQLQRAYRSPYNLGSKEETDEHKSNILSIVRKLDSSDLEIVDFADPVVLQAKLNAGERVNVPEFQSLPEILPGGDNPLHFRKMIIYDVSEQDKTILHKWKDRVNLIASGSKTGSTCRFSASPMPNMPARPLKSKLLKNGSR